MIETSKQMWDSWAKTDLCFDGNLSDVEKKVKQDLSISCFVFYAVSCTFMWFTFHFSMNVMLNFSYILISFSNLTPQNVQNLPWTVFSSIYSPHLISDLIQILLSTPNRRMLDHFRLQSSNVYRWLPFSINDRKFDLSTRMFFCFFLSIAIFTKFFPTSSCKFFLCFSAENYSHYTHRGSVKGGIIFHFGYRFARLPAFRMCTEIIIINAIIWIIFGIKTKQTRVEKLKWSPLLMCNCLPQSSALRLCRKQFSFFSSNFLIDFGR